MDSLQRVLAKKYAHAFLNLFGSELTEDLVAHIKEFVDFMQQRKKTLFYLELVALDSYAKKEALLKALAQFNVNSVFARLVDVLIAHRRLVLLPDISMFIGQFYKERHNIMDFSVTSSHELLQKQKHIIEKFLRERTHKRLVLSYSVDPELIAGIRIVSLAYKWEHSICKQLRALSHMR